MENHDHGKKSKVEEKVKTMIEGNRWLKDNGLPVRGHVLVWPGFQKLPEKYAKAERDGNLNWNELRQDIIDHIHRMGELTRDDTFEWDVLNEPYSNHDLTDHFGDEIMLEWFKHAKKAFPSHGLFLNDYGILRTGEHNLKHREHFFKTIQYFIDQHSEMNGFAMQGHFDEGNINTPEGVWKVIEQLGKHDIDMRITEFDCDSLDKELVADYLEDILTLTFSHPRMLGFQVWGFWEESMNVPTSALVASDGSFTPAGLRYRDLMFHRWWTHENPKSNGDGEANLNVFYGQHEISIEHKGKTLTQIIHVQPDIDREVYDIQW